MRRFPFPVVLALVSALAPPAAPGLPEPDSEEWTYLENESFRLGVHRASGAMNSSCSYLAPIKTFALKPALQVDYDAYLCLGSASEIRSRFTALQSGRPNTIR